MAGQGLQRREILRILGVAAVASHYPGFARWTYAAAHPHAAGDAPKPRDYTPQFFSAAQFAVITHLTELIIPQTETPGAKAARVNEFIDLVLSEAGPAERREFLRGLAFMDARSRELFGADFVSSTPEQQTALLTILSARGSASAGDQLGRDFFESIKSLTVTGYYTTEIGLRQELGEDGALFLASYPGCQHPQHKG